MAGEKILIVDDDADIREILTMYLEEEKFKVISVNDGYQAISTALSEKPDFIILDMMLPGLDGIEVCQEIRKKLLTPIMFLSAKTTPADKTIGLIGGGDDYMSKPFDANELIARVKAHLRRNRALENKLDSDNNVISYTNLTIDPASFHVTSYGREIVLQLKEFQILLLLAQNPNLVITNEQIYKSLWQTDSLGDYSTLMVHISNIRKKIELNPKKPMFIQTIKSVGYKFIAE